MSKSTVMVSVKGNISVYAGRLFALLAPVLFGLLSLYQSRPPDAVPTDAPLTNFSSGRAMKHLRLVARNQHPIGSFEHGQVRAYILNELKGLGVDAQVQTTTAINRDMGTPLVAGTINNILARLKGMGDGKAVLLASHYDSVTTGPGAADDGAAVAGLLETLRALKSSAPLKNDVIALFTDGEEAGLLGARAFAGEHPWAKDVGLALNFEARGNGGPVWMFETSGQNGRLIEGFSHSARPAFANSLSYEIYRLLPNDTDFTVLKKAGIEGMNFAFINGVTHYHTALDSVDNIDERSLQHHGDYALSLARHFGNRPLGGQRKPDAIYFDALGLAFFHYPSSWVLPVIAFVTLLYIGIVRLGLRRKQLDIKGLVLGAVLFFLYLVVCPAVVAIVWLLIKNLHAEYKWFPHGDTYNSSLYLTGFVAGAVAVASLIYTWFQKKTRMQNLALGGLFWWVVFLLSTSFFLPGASYLFTWPLLFCLMAFGVVFAPAGADCSSLRSMYVFSLSAAPAIILFVPLVYFVFIALTVNLSWAVILLGAPLLAPLIPYLHFVRAGSAWIAPVILAALSLTLFVAAGFTAGFDVKRPKPTNLFYCLNADTKEAFWASANQEVDEWTSQFFPEGAARIAITEYLPLSPWRFLTGPAEAAALPPPEVSVLEERRDGDFRTLRLRVHSPRQSPFIILHIGQDAEAKVREINGKRLDSDDAPEKGKPGYSLQRSRSGDNQTVLYYYGLPPEGIALTLEAKSSRPLRLRAIDQSSGLPQLRSGSFRPRPDYMMPAPYQSSDTTIVTRLFNF